MTQIGNREPEDISNANSVRICGSLRKGIGLPKALRGGVHSI